MRDVFRKDTDCALTAPPPFHPLPAVSSNWVPTHLTESRTHRDGASRYREGWDPKTSNLQNCSYTKNSNNSTMAIICWDPTMGQAFYWELNVTFKMGLPWKLRWWRICLHFRKPRFDPWAGKIPWRRKWLSTLVFLPRGAWQATVGWQRVGHD